MKCPNCKYEKGYTWIGDDYKEIVPEKDFGDFWKLALQMEREDNCSYYRDTERANVYACPKCKMMFIGD